MAHGDAREGKWRGNWRMQWVASTLHTTSEHGISSITTADAHTTATSSRLNWRPPADLNGLVRFAERRNLISARVPSHFKRSLPSIGGTTPLIHVMEWVEDCCQFYETTSRYPLIRRTMGLRTSVGVWKESICCFFRDRSTTPRLRSSVVIVNELRVLWINSLRFLAPEDSRDFKLCINFISFLTHFKSVTRAAS